MAALGIAVPAWLSTATTIASGALSVLSTLSSVNDAKHQARMEADAARRQALESQRVATANAAAAETDAANLEQEAGATRADSQRRAAEQRRQTLLRLSAARAAGAASGAGGYENELKAIDEVGAFNVMSELFSGNRDAVGLEYEAENARFRAQEFRYAGYTAGERGNREVKAAYKKGKRGVTSALISGAGSLAGTLDKLSPAAEQQAPEAYKRGKQGKRLRTR